jgi:hypothetical protein
MYRACTTLSFVCAVFVSAKPAFDLSTFSKHLHDIADRPGFVFPSDKGENLDEPLSPSVTEFMEDQLNLADTAFKALPKDVQHNLTESVTRNFNEQFSTFLGRFPREFKDDLEKQLREGIFADMFEFMADHNQREGL